MAGTFKLMITESSGEIQNPRYRYIWSARLEGKLLGDGHAHHPHEALSQAQELLDPEDIDDLVIDYGGPPTRWP